MRKLIERPIRKPHVICGQEVKLSGDGIQWAKQTAQHHGWTCSIAPAVVTKDGGDRRHRSAGTLVATPSHVGSELLWPFGREDLSPQEAPGRLTGRWVNIVGGIAVLSMYLEDSVGWSDLNETQAVHLVATV